VTDQTANLNIIEQRWPDVRNCIATAASLDNVTLNRESPQPTLYINGIHLSSGYDQVREAELQATLIPADSPQAWVYGVGTGQLPRTLLRRLQMKRLVVVIMNPGVAMESFRHFDHSDWLSDGRVELKMAEHEADINVPFAAIPSCLELAADAAARLRDCVFLELSTPLIRKRYGAGNPELKSRLEQNRKHILSDGDAAALFGRKEGSTILVAAAGPTLDLHYDWIAARQETFPLIAVDAALRPLMSAGIVPDIVVAVDAASAGTDFFKEIDLAVLREKPLVYFPVVHSDILENWPGIRLTAYPDHPLYQSLRKTHPKGTLFCSGSVLHPSVDLAVKMGAFRIVLLGTDFSFPGGRSHASGCPRNHLPKDDASKKHWVLNGRGERILTYAGMRGFLRDFERYIDLHPEVRFINGSREGAHIKGTGYLED
jgi:hypothetical protein